MKGEKEERRLWLPIQTIYNKELQVAEFLREQEIEYYIPMMYEARDLPSGECEHVLVPAIHNLLFIHREYDKDWCYKLLQTSPYPLYFLKRERNGREYCTISEKEMDNFMRHRPTYSGHTFYRPTKTKRQRRHAGTHHQERPPLRHHRQTHALRQSPLCSHRNASEHRPAESQLHLVRNRNRINFPGTTPLYRPSLR